VYTKTKKKKEMKALIDCGLPTEVLYPEERLAADVRRLAIK
jgi:hypothetical protein